MKSPHWLTVRAAHNRREPGRANTEPGIAWRILATQEGRVEGRDRLREV